MTRQFWTDSQVEYLTVNAPTTPVATLAAYLNKSISSVRSKIQRLNIQKLDEFAIEHLRRVEAAKQANAIKLLTPKKPTSDSVVENSFTDIALILGMSRKTVLGLYASGMSKISKYLKDNPDVADEWVLQIMNDERYSQWDFID